jgi:hypothetical protein
MSCFIASSLSLIHHLYGDVRTITLTLITSNASILFHNLIQFERKDLDWADLYTEQAAFTVNLVPNHIQP